MLRVLALFTRRQREDFLGGHDGHFVHFAINGNWKKVVNFSLCLGVQYQVVVSEGCFLTYSRNHIGDGGRVFLFRLIVWL